MSSMSSRDRKILLAIVPVLVIVAYWFLLFSPKREEAATAKKEMTEQQERLKSARALAAQANGSKTNFAADYGEIVRLGKAIPARVDMPSLLVQLDRAAEGTGITFTRIAQGERTAPAVAAPVATVTPPADQTGSGTPATPRRPPARPRPRSRPAARPLRALPAPRPRRPTAPPRPRTRQTPLPSSRAWTQRPPPRPAAACPWAAAPATPAADGTGTVTSGGLETVPLELSFVGNFFNLADFFHDVKRFVRVANNSVVVNGRLVTIESSQLHQRPHDLPAHQGGAHGDGLPLAAGPGRDRRSDPRGSRLRPPRPPRRRLRPTERLPPRPLPRPPQRPPKD